MTRGRSGLMATLALMLSIDFSAHASDDVPEVHVEIIDYSSAGWTLLAARAEVKKIYESAGIRLLITTASNSVRTLPNAVQVVVLSGRASGRMRIDRVPPGVLGYSVFEARRVYVFYDRVGNEAARPNGRVVALGRVIAHELGHLLSGRSGHSVDGLMQAKLDLHSRFSPPLLAEQAQLIRDRLLEARRLAR